MALGARIIEAMGSAGRLAMPGVSGATRAFVAASLIAQDKLPVLVARDQSDAEALYRDLSFLLGTSDDRAAANGILFLGADERSPFEAYSPDPRTVMERINTLYRLCRESPGVQALVVTPTALSTKQIPPSTFDSAFEYLLSGEVLDRDRLLGALVRWGYNAVSVVEDPGTFSVRGGIIDVFSPYLPEPVRIDLFGDEIESIRCFDPSTQRATVELEDAIILPAKEIVFDEEIIAKAKATIDGIADEGTIPTRRLQAVLEDIDNQIHFFGIETLLPIFHDEGLVATDVYLPKGADVVYLLGDRDSMEARWADVLVSADAGYSAALSRHEIAIPPQQHVTDGHNVLETVLAASASIALPEVEITRKDAPPSLRLETEATDQLRAEILRATKSTEENVDLMKPVTDRLERWRRDGLRTLIVCHTRGQAERLKSLLAPKGVDVRLRTQPLSFDDIFGDPTKGSLAQTSIHAHLVLGEISSGFVLPAGRLALLSEEEIFGQRMKRRKSRKAAAGAFISDLAELKPGDFVVHIDFGIGKYHGMTRLAVNGVDGDFLNIEYRGGDKLYLPVHRLRLVQKYANAEEGRSPVLSKLGATTWSNTKKRVKDTLLKMAAELLRLYAMRESLEGFALAPPSESFTEFEAEFQFEATQDQASAIKDVIEDLGKPKPMDRLICGDVGYGKTEVAMRAAMLAVMSKTQVAVLVPTTVLAAQHYQVFSERFANQPVRIGVVSRFQTREQIKQTLRELASGSLDVIIGTHRLLSKDVKFKNLSLLVVDEEQRFGVAHKEKLKKYRATVHVLTMSATPIPRTMHMGMMGVRDLSMIATPPVDRLAVKTEVHKFSEDVIREAVLKEIRRGGQCFVVHNRVASIDAFARMLGKLVPEARVVVGHGQMGEDVLEKVMVDFMNKEYNVLLSTTIIESGIDIASANTIIINRADRMGLAQLYQLRGRVGRSRVRGFCHFLIPAGTLSKDARKRIAVLQRFTELGAGFKVASHDLEIRGAGNILGKQQSGPIAAIGFAMYQDLLKEAVEELQGAAAKHLKEPEIQLPVVALLPDNYIPQPGERLRYYQRFNAADTDETTYDLLQELTDLYGTPPAEVENLTELMLVKQRLSRLGALNLDYGGETKTMPPRFVIRFDDEVPGISPRQLVTFVQRAPRARKLVPDGRLMVYLAHFDDLREIVLQIKEQLNQLLEQPLDSA